MNERLDLFVTWGAMYLSLGVKASGTYTFEGDTNHGTLTVAGSASLESFGGYAEGYLWGFGYERNDIPKEEIFNYPVSETYNLY